MTSWHFYFTNCQFLGLGIISAINNQNFKILNIKTYG